MAGKYFMHRLMLNPNRARESEKIRTSRSCCVMLNLDNNID